MCGGSDPPKQRASAQEKALAATSLKKMKFQLEHLGPLEKEQLNKAMGGKLQEFEEQLLGGQANADIAQASATALTQAGLGAGDGRFVSAVGDVARTTGAAAESAQLGAGLQAQARGDDRLNRAIATGLDVDRVATAGLADATNRATSRGLAKLQAKQIENSSKMQAAGTVAGALTSAGLLKLDKHLAAKAAKEETTQNALAMTGAVSGGLTDQINARMARAV